MKKILFFLVLGLASISIAYGTSLNIFCDEEACFDFGVEYLYLKPTIHDPFFVIPERGPTNTNDPNGRRFANELEYHSGVRAMASYYLFPCHRISTYVEGTYISDSHDKTHFFGTAAPLSLATKGNPNADLDSVEGARSCIDYCFWNVKGGLRYCFCLPCPFLLAANINVHYVDLDYKEKIFYDETGNNVFVAFCDDNIYAVGPEIGLDFGYQIFQCLSFVTRGSFGLLVASHEPKNSSIDITDGGVVTDNVFAKNDALCSVIPATELKVGLNYNGCFCDCFNAEIEIGFDIIRYSDLIDRIRWVGDDSESEGLSLDYFSPFMLHGLYASVNVSF